MRTTLGLPWLSCGARFPGPHLQATARALGCPFHLSWPHLLLVSATPACSSLGLPACGHREAAWPPGPSLGQAFPPRGYNTSALGKGRWGEGTLPHPPAPSSLTRPQHLPGERRNAQGPSRASSSNPPTNLGMQSVPSSRLWGGLPPDPQPTVHPFCPSSPFKIKVLPAHDASKVRASGPGLNASGIPASLPVEFTIDARDAGEGLLTVQILVSPGGAHLPGQGLGTGRP